MTTSKIASMRAKLMYGRSFFMESFFFCINFQIGVAGFPNVEILRAAGTRGGRFLVKISVLGEAGTATALEFSESDFKTLATA